MLGSTGESVMLSWMESSELLKQVKRLATPEKLLIAGTGAESTAETIQRTKFAATDPVALVKTPYYYKPVYGPGNLLAPLSRGRLWGKFMLHPLAGDRKGQMSARLNRQWRVIFKVLQGELIVEALEVTPHKY